MGTHLREWQQEITGRVTSYSLAMIRRNLSFRAQMLISRLHQWQGEKLVNVSYTRIPENNGMRLLRLGFGRRLQALAAVDAETLIFGNRLGTDEQDHAGGFETEKNNDHGSE